MAVTKEQVQAEAKKLEITLSDEQVAAHVTLGTLPTKPDSGGGGGAGGGDDDDPDGGTHPDDSDRVKRRIKKLADDRNEARKKSADLEKRLKALEEEKAAGETRTKEEKGQYETLKAEAATAKATAEATQKAAKEALRKSVVSQKVSTALVAAGLFNNVEEAKRGDRMTTALKLFDFSKVTFSWTNEEQLEYEVEDVGDLVKEFAKTNDFLFASGGEGGPRPFSGANPPGSGGGGQTLDEKKVAALKEKFPALNQ